MTFRRTHMFGSCSLSLSPCVSLSFTLFLYLAHLFCVSLYALQLWLLEDPPRLSYAQTNDPLMQSSHGSDEMQCSLHQLGMSRTHPCECKHCNTHSHCCLRIIPSHHTHFYTLKNTVLIKAKHDNK